MELTPNTRLGPYEIIARLGAGGMGEVWRARDTRLERDVAIKVLPAGLAQNPDLKARFEREAKTISQLNHPNICTLHDIGNADGVDFLVMELIEGESLADRIAKGPLPVSEVLKVGTEVAEALHRAHRAGVVHRDLKPGNIMLTKSGAKLLDFGLAKSGAGVVQVDDATVQKPLTQEGTILGTFQYMAPEQLEGQEADPRTDIFALGAVLYEMATGQRAFTGKTKTSLIASIVKEDPRPIADMQPLTPPALQHVVDKCLAKDPDDRWQSALDVGSELRWISSAGSQAGVAAPLTSRRVRRSRILTTLAIIGWTIAITAVVIAVMTREHLREANRVTWAELSAETADAQDGPLAVSPDGRRVAIEIPGTASRLTIRDLDNGTTKPLAGTEGATFPFWAPDGHAVGFFAGGKLKTVNADSGAVQTICDAPYGRGGSWSPLGVIVFAPNIADPIMKVTDSGGTPAAVTKLAPAHSDRNPMFLPDGKHFLYCSVPARATVEGTIRAGSIDGDVDRKVLGYASNMSLVDGQLLTVKDRNLVAQHFDPDALALDGKPIVLAQNVDFYLARFVGTFGVGAGTLVFQNAPRPKRQLLRLDPGEARPVAVGDEAAITNPAISPDGRRAVADRQNPATGGEDLWLVDLERGTSTRLTFSDYPGGGDNESAAFSPDGERLAMAPTDAEGITRLWVQPAGGGSRENLLPDSYTDFLYVTDWSRDGKALLIAPQRPVTGLDVEVLPLDGSQKAVPLVHGPADELGGRFSPNGRWVAYESNESGRSEVYVTNVPGATAKWQVSTEGGSSPSWSADGKSLYYLAGDRVVVAAVHEGASFSADVAKPVDALGDHIVAFTVAWNGTILAIRENDPGRPPLTIVRNWEGMLDGE